ncbi:L-dopachrome tautomerase-related protein [Acetobacter fallax]|uniref:Gluconolactonase n=1 Tax=Acetobacter fallax TaxID=1737473 RepID=A0ABX0KD03_9PROT|nr:L-dopachrome tautomerase-related protein [Acetobacter fallax]NHO31832.1 gluconolactonase [Acetobacter fallax]NHO35405.1 gluconolactonase [Acetobacter fallax]
MLKKTILSGVAAGVFALASVGEAAPLPSSALHVAVTSQRVMNAVTVSDDKRLFVSFPYWGGGSEPGPTVAELDAKGVPHAWPDESWNNRGHEHDLLHNFVRVNAIRIGPDGYLWVVDSGDANVGGKPNPPDGAPAKLVAFDLSSGKPVHTIVLKQGTTPHSYVDDLRFHGDTLILTDAGDPGLILVNLKTGQQRRVLQHAKSTTDERPMYAEGKLLISNGKPARVHADQLEVSPDGSVLYFQPSSGPMWKISTADLENPTLNDEDLSRRVSLFYDTPTTGGTVIDGQGNLYVSDVNKLRLLKITPQGRASVLIADKRLVWADAMWIDSTGKLWIPAVQLNRTASFQADGVSRVQRPVAIYTLDLGLEPQHRF